MLLFSKQQHLTNLAVWTLASLGAISATTVTTAQQPGCGPWSPLGAGVEGKGTLTVVGDMVVFDDGTGPALFVAGNFTSAGGAPANYVAKWDGSTWAALGTGTNREVETLAVFDDGTGPALYAAGDFTSAGGLAAAAIARWDGTSWIPVGSGLDDWTFTLEVFDDGSGEALYAGGLFDFADGRPAPGVAKWDGTEWSALGDGITSWVYTLKSLDTASGPALFAGTRNEPFVRRWDGAVWQAVPGFPNRCFDLEVFDAGSGPRLYGLGGDGVSRFDQGGWTDLPIPPVEGRATELAVLDDGTGDALYVGGITGDLAKWDGVEWTELPGLNEDIFSLATFDDGSGEAIYAGGKFTSASGISTSRIAVLRQSCPTTKFTGGSFLAEGLARACGSAPITRESSGPAEPTIVSVRYNRFVEGPDPRDPDYVADIDSDLEATISEDGDSQVLRVKGDIDVYAFSFVACTSEASVTIDTMTDLGEPSPILVQIPEAVDVTIDGSSSGSTTIELADSSGSIVTEGRIEGGTYELTVSMSASAITPAPFPSEAFGEASLDWSFTFTPIPCRADLDGDGELTIFDFLAFQNAFDVGDPIADFDGDGDLTLFDFLAFQNEFDAGCD